MLNLKNITPSNLIDSLPHFEYADREKRIPKFHKFRMMKVKGFEVYDRRLMRIVPDEEFHGFTAEQLNKLIPIDEMLEKVPKEIERNGGWLIFDGVFMKNFITNQEHTEEYRQIQDTLEEMVAPVRKYEITKITKTKNGEDWIIKTGETQWYWIGVIFSILRPRVKDWMTISANKQFGIIRNPDAVDYVPARYRDKNGEIDEEAMLYEKPVKQPHQPHPKHNHKPNKHNHNRHHVNRDQQISEEEQAQIAHHQAAMANEESVELVSPPEEILVEADEKVVHLECAEECGGCHDLEDNQLTEEERQRTIDFLKNDLQQSA